MYYSLCRTPHRRFALSLTLCLLSSAAEAAQPEDIWPAESRIPEQEAVCMVAQTALIAKHDLIHVGQGAAPALGLGAMVGQWQLSVTEKRAVEADQLLANINTALTAYDVAGKLTGATHAALQSVGWLQNASVRVVNSDSNQAVVEGLPADHAPSELVVRWKYQLSHELTLLELDSEIALVDLDGLAHASGPLDLEHARFLRRITFVAPIHGIDKRDELVTLRSWAASDAQAVRTALDALLDAAAPVIVKALVWTPQDAASVGGKGHHSREVGLAENWKFTGIIMHENEQGTLYAEAYHGHRLWTYVATPVRGVRN